MLRTADEIGPLQLMILAALWELGQATAHEIQARLEGGVAYNTISTVLRRLEAKGFVAHIVPGRAFVFSPAISRQEVEERVLSPLVPHLFETYGDLRRATLRLENSLRRSGGKS